MRRPTWLRCPIGDGATAVQGLNGDLTERRLAEAARVRVTKQMPLLVDSTGQGFYGLDADGKCPFINKAMSEMIGYQP
jgi:PAS domain-containing protein